MKTSSRNVRSALMAAAVAAAVAVTVAHGNHYILEPDDTPIGAPGAMLADAHGNVYFTSQNVVFRLAGDGKLTRVAGTGVPGFSGDGGPATDAQLHVPDDYPELRDNFFELDAMRGGLALDTAGNLYIADTYNNRVRRVDPAGTITTVVAGMAPDFGYPYSPTDTSFTWPQGLAADGDGNLYVLSAFGSLSRIAPDGTATRILSNNCWSSRAGLCGPQQLTLGPEASVFVVNHCTVVDVTPGGRITEILGRFVVPLDEEPCGHDGDGRHPKKTLLAWPYGVAVDRAGSLYVADTWNHCIRKLDASGNVSTVAGSCTRYGYSGDRGPATEALLFAPKGVAVDAGGNLYIADTLNHRIRKVTPDGTIATVAGNGADLRR